MSLCIKYNNEIKESTSALMIAATRGSHDIVDLLLQHGAIVEKEDEVKRQVQ